MTLIDFSAIGVAVIAAIGAFLAQRSAAKASKYNVAVSGRLDAEKEAYERARVFDLETIDRQDAEIRRLRKLNSKLNREIRNIRKRLARIERLYPEWERLLHERINEDDD